MITLHCYKAQPTVESVKDLCLVFDIETPSRETLAEQVEMFKVQAETLADALFETLPGGLFDALMIELMRRKVSLFVVAHQGYRA